MLHKYFAQLPVLFVQVISILLLSCCADDVLGSKEARDSNSSWELHWSEEFDREGIDPGIWSFECTSHGYGDQMFQTFLPSPENSFTKNGKLHLRPTLLENNINPATRNPFGADFLKNGTLDLRELYNCCTYPGVDNEGCYREGRENWTNIPPAVASRVKSKQGFAFRYGRLEIRAKGPTGDWLKGAVWFMPENSCYGGWPVSGEIDLIALIGNEDYMYESGGAIGMQRTRMNTYYGVQSPDDPAQIELRSNGSEHYNWTANYGRNFHVFAMEWSPDGISMYIDDVLTNRFPDPPISQNPDWSGFFDYGKPWTVVNDSDPNQNPWKNSNDPNMAPFDCKFHIFMNVAVGGTGGSMPNKGINRGGDYPKSWNTGASQITAMNQFYQAKDDWLWTWEKEDVDEIINSAFQVDYVRVYKRADLPPEDPDDCPTT